MRKLQWKGNLDVRCGWDARSEMSRYRPSQCHCKEIVRIPEKEENHSRKCKGDDNGAFFH